MLSPFDDGKMAPDAPLSAVFLALRLQKGQSSRVAMTGLDVGDQA
jgi:hypothetical protein